MRKEFAVPGSSYGAHAGCQTFAVDVINGLSSHIKHNCIDQLDIVKAVGIIRLKQKKKALSMYCERKLTSDIQTSSRNYCATLHPCEC